MKRLLNIFLITFIYSGTSPSVAEPRCNANTQSLIGKFLTFVTEAQSQEDTNKINCKLQATKHWYQINDSNYEKNQIKDDNYRREQSRLMTTLTHQDPEHIKFSNSGAMQLSAPDSGNKKTNAPTLLRKQGFGILVPKTEK